MKAALLALCLVAGLAQPAWAGPCDDELRGFNADLAKAKLQPDVASQLKDMQAQVEKLCAAGNEEEASDVLSEAMSILSAQ